MDRELRILLDERAIDAVMNDYCHAMDSGQHERWMNCFTADAVYDVVLPDGRTFTHLEGEDDLRRFITAYTVVPGNRHIYVTPLFDVDPNAGTASVSAYWLMLSGGAHTAGVSAQGSVRDKFVRAADGRWRMKERRVTVEGMVP
jgi:hypothetical protein